MASDLSILIPRLRAAIAALPPGTWPLDGTTLQVLMSARRVGKAVQTYVELAAKAVPALLEHAELYEHLRMRPLDTIALAKGGVFAGRVPDNVVLNGEDLDRAIREDMGQQQPAQAQLVAPELSDECIADLISHPLRVYEAHEARQLAEAVARSAWHAGISAYRARVAAAPTEQPRPAVALVAAVDEFLENAECECPEGLRFGSGLHLSGCRLFDLNEARIADLANEKGGA